MIKRIAVVGCGLRSDCYLHELRGELGKEWKVTALADPSTVAREVFIKNFGGSETIRTFKDGPELFGAMGNELDAVIIGSPNSLHLESLLPALERRLVILLEKPVATSLEQAVAIWRGFTKAQMPPVAVGFVLRYTAFYRKVKKLLDSGVIGQVLSMEATEMLTSELTAMYTRGWRRFDKLAGSFILEKCSHDMDLLNWFAGSQPVRVSSLATRTRFVPMVEVAMHCRDCKLSKTCRYSAKLIEPYLMNVSRREEIGKLIPGDNDLCVFNSEKDVPDHQVMNIEYADGILATFSLCMDQPETTRTIKINGTMGQIIGEVTRDVVSVKHHRTLEQEQFTMESFPITHDDSGHHGGDSILCNQLKAMLRGQTVPPLAGLREGIEACLVAFAAEDSRRTNKIIDVNAYYNDVFGS